MSEEMNTDEGATVEEGLSKHMAQLVEIAEAISQMVIGTIGQETSSRIVLVAPAIMAAKLLAMQMPTTDDKRQEVLHRLIDALVVHALPMRLNSKVSNVNGGN